MQLENDVYDYIRQMIDEGSSRLEIIESCMSEFGDEYPDYEYEDWSKVVKSLMSSEEDNDEVDIFIPAPSKVSSISTSYKKLLDKLTRLIDWAESSSIPLEKWAYNGVSKWNKRYNECIYLCKCLELDYIEKNIDESLYLRISDALNTVDEYTSRLQKVNASEKDYFHSNLPVNIARRSKIKVPDNCSRQDKYLALISAIPPITWYERRRLLAMYFQKGDKAALDAIIESLLPTVCIMAKQINERYPEVDLQELVGEGVCELAGKFPLYIEKYGWYATRVYVMSSIRQRMANFAAEDSSLLSIPARIVALEKKISEIVEKNYVEGGFPISYEDLAEKANVLVGDVEKASIAHDIKVLPLEVCDNVYQLEKADTPVPDRGLMNESLQREVDRVLTTLTSREECILRDFFGIGCPEKSLEEIGEYMNLTRERVRQIKDKAIRRIRERGYTRILSTYLGDRSSVSDVDTDIIVRRTDSSLSEVKANNINISQEDRSSQNKKSKEDKLQEKAKKSKLSIEEKIQNLLNSNLNKMAIPDEENKRYNYIFRLISETRKIISLLFEWMALKKSVPSLEMINNVGGYDIILELDRNYAILASEPKVAPKTIEELRTNIEIIHQHCKFDDPQIKTNDALERYIHHFRNLKRSIHKGQRAPHKVILLLAIIAMYRNSTQQETDKLVKSPVLIKIFDQYWQKNVHSKIWANDIHMPWKHMISEPFWHYDETTKTTYIDKELRELLKETENRVALREVLREQL